MLRYYLLSDPGLVITYVLAAVGLAEVHDNVIIPAWKYGRRKYGQWKSNI